jgi:hypothetical protein
MLQEAQTSSQLRFAAGEDLASIATKDRVKPIQVLTACCLCWQTLCMMCSICCGTTALRPLHISSMCSRHKETVMLPILLLCHPQGCRIAAADIRKRAS